MIHFRSLGLAVAVMSCSTASATLRYVDGATGDNANDGNSPNTAWLTIQQAFDFAQPDDTVYIRGGIYAEHVVMNVSHVYFSNYPGEEVIIDGDPSLGTTILTIEAQSFVTIKGITIQGLITPDAIGIRIRGGEAGFVNRITLDSIDVHGIGWTDDPGAIPGPDDNAQPIIVTGESNTVIWPLIKRSNVHDNITGFSEAISFDGDVVQFGVFDCEVHDNTNIGIHAGGNYGVAEDPELDHARGGRITDNHCWNNVSSYATSAGIYVDGGWSTFIERNVCEGNGYGIEIGCEENGTTENIEVWDNVVRFNHEAGLAIGGYTEATTGQVLDCSVRNNTFFRNDMDNTGSGELDITKVSDCQFYNNIFHTTEQGILLSREEIAPQNNNVVNYNDWYVPNSNADEAEVNWGANTVTGFATYQSTSGWDANGFFADPLFTDPTADPPDLALQWNSACIDASDPTTVTLPDELDAAGLPRLNGENEDIGAYEYQAPMSVPAVDPPDFTLAPNPFTDALFVTGVPPGTRLDLSDMSGRSMLSTRIPMNGRIDTHTLCSGIYVAQFRSEHEPILFQRIVKR